MAQFLGTQLHHTTAYHPQSNGLVEPFHCHIKSALRACLSSPSCTRDLPWVLFGIRTAPKEDLGCFTAELVYSYPLTVPGDFISSQLHTLDRFSELRHLRDHAHTLGTFPTSYHKASVHASPNNLRKAKFVFVMQDAHCTSLQRPSEGPFRVIESGAKTFKLDIRGRTETITVNRLKLAHLDLDCPIEVAQLRPRGRPQHGSKPKVEVPKEASPSISTDLPQHTRSSRQINRPSRYIRSLGWVV